MKNVKRPGVDIKIEPKGVNVVWNARRKTLHITPFAGKMKEYVAKKKALA